MVTEKIRAAAKQAASALSGKAGILNTLEGEHAEVLALMEKILSSTSPIAKAAEAHYPTMRRKLLLHLRAEQEVLYPACNKRPLTAKHVSGAREQHTRMEGAVQTLDGTPVESDRFRDELRDLYQLAQDHMRQEEHGLFLDCEDAFEAHELRQLDREYAEARERHEVAMVDISLLHTPAAGGRHVPPSRP